jgi:hypothetical protein
MMQRVWIALHVAQFFLIGRLDYPLSPVVDGVDGCAA